MPMRDTLEIIYFITAGPGLLCAAGVGLMSLYLSKRAMRMAEDRARLTATAEQIRYFAESIAPKCDALAECLTKEFEPINFAENYEITLEEGGIKLGVSDDLKAQFTPEKVTAVLDTFLPALNSLSAWSSYFIHGVADVGIGYRTVGPDFVAGTEQCLPFVILLHKEEAHGDLLALYKSWKARSEADAIIDVHSELMSRLAGLRKGLDSK